MSYSPMAFGMLIVDGPNNPKVDITIYKSLTGSLNCLICIGPYVLFVVAYVDRFVVDLRGSHWMEAKRIFKTRVEHSLWERLIID